MAAKLQCEICGGKLIGKPGGIFECESCGTEYSTEWAKAKIQEITGTVKVEGTVEVQGSVKVEGPVKVEGAANKESLLKRGYMALEDGRWEDARKYFNEALNADAEYADSYLGLALSALELHREQEIGALNQRESVAALESNADYQRFTRFAPETRKAAVDVFLVQARDAVAELEHREAVARAEQERREAEERAEQERRKAERREKRIIELAPLRERIRPCQGMIDAGDPTVGVRFDGTVLATGYEKSGACNVRDWTNIIAIASGNDRTVGLRSDGTVLAVGKNDYGQCRVRNWSNIIAIAAGDYHTVGLRSDGTMVAVGRNDFGQCNVGEWTDIVAISAGFAHTVGLRSDGTVVATKLLTNNNLRNEGQCSVSDWKHIVSIAAASYHTIGLRSDGTVVAVGSNQYGDVCSVTGWSDIIAIASGFSHTVALRSDGTVLAVGAKDKGQCQVKKWRDIVAIAAGFRCTVGLRADGTLVSAGENSSNQCNVSSWRLFNRVDTLKQEQKDYIERKEMERRKWIESLKNEQSALQTELANLKGLFSGKRRKEIEARLAEIDLEMKKLN